MLFITCFQQQKQEKRKTPKTNQTTTRPFVFFLHSRNFRQIHLKIIWTSPLSPLFLFFLTNLYQKETLVTFFCRLFISHPKKTFRRSKILGKIHLIDRNIFPINHPYFFKRRKREKNEKKKRICSLSQRQKQFVLFIFCVVEKRRHKISPVFFLSKCRKKKMWWKTKKISE